MQLRYLPLVFQSFALLAQAQNGALYFLDNSPSGSYVAAMSVANGAITGSPVLTSTGGYGALSTNSSGDSVGADPLGAQGPVQVYGNMLFTVNSGSATVSMFTINPDDPTQLTLMGSPVSTLGDFPMSLTYSPAVGRVCVLNGGSTAGVTCMHVDPTTGIQPAKRMRPLPQTIISETTPPNGPPGAASQILFNPQSTALFVTIRGVPGSHMGSILVYPTGHRGGVSHQYHLNQFSDLPLPFGFQFIGPDTMFLSDPSFGVALLNVNSDWTLTETARTAFPAQKAICWTAADAQANRLYALDAGSGSLWNTDYLLTAQAPINYTEANGMTGLFDGVVANGILYALGGAIGIEAINLSDGTPMGFTDISQTFPNRANLCGMAWFGS